MQKRVVISLIAVCAIVAIPAGASDRGRPGQRPLHLAWSYRANQPPSPAFKGGLAAGRRSERVEPIRYDYVFQPVVGHGRVFFGSSTEEAVYGLDAQTGEQLWVFHTNGPVRIAPTLWQDRIYFGSDDGYVYCLDQASGSLAWKYRAAPSDRRAIGNGRVISAWPVRTSIAMADGVAYFGAGLFPTLGTYLHAVDMSSGEPVWCRQIPYSPHGQILIDGDNLLVATGRTCPAEFRRSDGAPLVEKPNARRAQGSSYVGRAGDMIFWGPCESGLLHIRVSPEPIPDLLRGSADAVITGQITGLKGWSMVADEQLVYLLRDEEALAIEKERFRTLALDYCRPSPLYKKAVPRKGQPWGVAAAGLLLKEHQPFFEQLKQEAAWSSENKNELKSLLLADGTLFAGGKDAVVAFDAGTSNVTWSHPVGGEALGLAVADGSLFVGTDEGRIYCFGQHPVENPKKHVPTSGSPYVDDPILAEAATTALRRADIHKGFCLVLGVGTGQLADEIARRSEFFVVALSQDSECVAEARNRLTKAGLYGKHVVVHHVPDDDLLYPDYFANLIVSEEFLLTGRLPCKPKTALRMLQPDGGTIMLLSPEAPMTYIGWPSESISDWKSITGESGITWHVAQRKALPGAGEWTHMYANPAATVSSGDRLVGPDVALQWFGPPGAEDVVERHAVAMPPLHKDGKLFVAGLYETVRAIDAYNGTNLWKVKVPESTRMMLSHNAGFMAAGAGVLFVVADHACWMLDAKTGEVVHKFAGIDPQSDWGYVGAIGDYLLGSNQKTPADEYSSGRRRGGDKFLVSARDLKSRPAVSENLFAYDHGTRKLAWKYENEGVILNPTICIGGDRVYFAESRNPAVVADPTGTASLPDFFAKDARLVVLDVHSGSELWSKPLDPLSENPDDEHEHMMFLSYADGMLLSTRTGHIDQKLGYRIEAVDAATGETKWDRALPSKHCVYAPLTYGKNGQQSHPSIVDGRIYLLSHLTNALITLDLHTGRIEQDPELFDFWIHSKTCAVPTASATGLYFRRNSCYMYDIPSSRAIDLTGVTRPSCWMSIIPAGGLVLMPEASAGCTCGFAMQTSLALAPRPRDGRDSQNSRLNDADRGTEK